MEKKERDRTFSRANEVAQIKVTGETAFDEKGNKVLVNQQGKVFAINETIEELWKEIEKLTLHYMTSRARKKKVEAKVPTTSELAKRLDTSIPERRVKKILEKLVEHKLLAFQ